MDALTDRQTNEQTDRQANRQTDTPLPAPWTEAVFTHQDHSLGEVQAANAALLDLSWTEGRSVRLQRHVAKVTRLLAWEEERGERERLMGTGGTNTAN